MCISCHPENSSVMPNVKTTVSPLAMPIKTRKYSEED